MFPARRMRRLRGRKVQPLLREGRLHTTDLVAPIFLDETIGSPKPIDAMPGQSRYPVASAGEAAGRLWDAGIQAVLLFGIPEKKDAGATGAYAPDGVVQQAVRNIRETVPEMVVITDVCACEYTDHGHCGIVGDTRYGMDLLNDPSLELMSRIALSHAESGADIVAPSCMLDGMVRSIRSALDTEGHADIMIMSYSTKFASAFYSPFREAAGSGYQSGDRSTYQIDPANGREAFRESSIDAEEGADILMVKPAGFYLDILSAVKAIGLPVAAYQVSGEYSMIRAACERGWLKERQAVLESLTCIKRAGADLIITYFAGQAAEWLNEEQ